MRFIEHPVADFPLTENRADRGAAKLLGRDQQDRRIAKTHLVECILPLRHGEHAVDRDTGRDPLAFHPLNLICHEGNKR